MLDKKLFFSFDGNISSWSEYHRPDRYRMIEKDLEKRFRIARGGGYSYAAASFGAGSIVQEMDSFNRVLYFNPIERIIEVEAGITLGNLLSVTGKQALWLPVQPGYPEITVGGCIAANVHGKNPYNQGAFIKSVVDIKIFHPNYGIYDISRTKEPMVFDMTCGGYGLTGVILSATLKLEDLPGTIVEIRRIPVGNFIDSLKVVRELTEKSAFVYAWHDAAPFKRTFGRGIVYQGIFKPDSDFKDDIVSSYRVITAKNRRILPFSIWGGQMTMMLNSFHIVAESFKSNPEEQQIFDSLFPFARRTTYFGYISYFHLYGSRGLVEYQIIVPYKEVESFLAEIHRLILMKRAAVVLISFKLFKGNRRLLRFENDGVCITLNFVRTREVLDFLVEIDKLVVETGIIPNIIKDSRLPMQVVQKCYPEYEVFRGALHSYDPERIFRSELSERLGL